MNGVRSNWSLYAVIALLIAQLVLFWLSLGEIMAISVFCTVTTGGAPRIFGFIHLAYLALFILGIVSLFWRRARLPYLIAIMVALLALPAQVWLLEQDVLRCDGP